MRRALYLALTMTLLAACGGDNGVCPAGQMPMIDTSAGPVTGEPGNPISIFGSNLGGNSATVSINDLNATNTGGGNQAITIIVPTGATTGMLTLNNGQGGCTTMVQFKAD
jgi:hypothetical protein